MSTNPFHFEKEPDLTDNEAFEENARRSPLALVPDIARDKSEPYEVASTTGQVATVALSTDQPERERPYSRPQNVSRKPHSSTLYLGTVAGTDCYRVPRYRDEA